MTTTRTTLRPDGAEATPAKAQSKGKDTKTLLATLRMTTTIGAVSLTLAGWGLLARAASVASAQDTQTATQSFTGSAAALLTATDAPAPAPALAPTASPATSARATIKVFGATANVNRAVLPTDKPSPTATAGPAAPATETNAVPAKVFTLNVVQWVRTRAGDPVAVVQDNSGVLWYVWGSDVSRIEQGLEPQYAPQAVNAVGRSRAS